MLYAQISFKNRFQALLKIVIYAYLLVKNGKISKNACGT